MRTGVTVCRLCVGAVFLVSGFVKAVDPLGTFYKLEEYFAAFGLLQWLERGWLLPFALLLPAVEFCAGVFLLFGVRQRLASTVALLLMAVMTPLALYLAVADPVSDCGCFGDAWVLGHWETFGKNVLLLAMTYVLFRWRGRMPRVITLKLEWMVSMYTILFSLVLPVYCLTHLPLLDFRPYKIGVNLRQATALPDSTWSAEPLINDFSIQLVEGREEITDRVLAAPGYTFLLVAHRLEEADDGYIDLINELYDYCLERGYGFYALTSSPEKEIDFWKERTGAEYPFCWSDDVVLKTMIRSNPGLMLLKDGVILNKWSGNQLPDEYVLTGPLEELPLGRLQADNQMQKLGRVACWFVGPLLCVLLMDLLWVRRREKKIITNPLNKQTK